MFKTIRLRLSCVKRNSIVPLCIITTGVVSSAGERSIAEVVVCAESDMPISPCGGCRQRLAEFGRADTVVRAAGPQGARARWTLGELLPAAFSLDDQE